jgi:hypothetical protein
MFAAVQVNARRRVAEDCQCVAFADRGHGLEFMSKPHATEGRRCEISLLRITDAVSPDVDGIREASMGRDASSFLAPQSRRWPRPVSCVGIP